MDIWANVDPNFRANVQDLCSTAKGRDLTAAITCISEERSERELELSWIPFKHERKLAKDFAFLTAWENSPGCVSAATICKDAGNQRTIVTIAANHGVAQAVTDTLKVIINLLSQCAMNAIPKAACAKRCLKAVVSLHRNRILGRLASSSYRRPKATPPKGPLKPISVSALQQVISALKKAKSAEEPDNASLVAQLSLLAKYINTVNQVTTDPSNVLLQQIIIAASDVYDTGRSFSLSQRLRQCGLSPDLLTGRSARQLRTLGNYWRICRYMVDMVTRLPEAFRGLNLKTIHFGSKKQTVHAEVQLLLHHESTKVAFPPRTIIASKRPCFLCFTFMNAYGNYHVPQSHGEIFEKWYLPSSMKADSLLRRRLNKALQITSRTVKETLTALQKSPSIFMNRISPAAQSVISSDLDGRSMLSMQSSRSSLDENVEVQQPSPIQLARNRKDSVIESPVVLSDPINEHPIASSSRGISTSPIHPEPDVSQSTDTAIAAEDVAEDFPIKDRSCPKQETRDFVPLLGSDRTARFITQESTNRTPRTRLTHSDLTNTIHYLQVGRVWLHLELETIRDCRMADAQLPSPLDPSIPWSLEIHSAQDGGAPSATVNLEGLCESDDLTIGSSGDNALSLGLRVAGQEDVVLEFPRMRCT